MKITNITTLDGVNRYSRTPVLHAHLQVETSELEQLNALSDHDAWLAQISARLPEIGLLYKQAPAESSGITALDLLPLIMLTLQNLSGCELKFRETRRLSEDQQQGGRFLILCEYESAHLAKRALRIALSLIRRILAKQKKSGLHPPKLDPEFSNNLAKFATIRKSFLQVAELWSLDASGRDIIKAAKARGIPCHRLNEKTHILQLAYGKNRRLTTETLTAFAGITGIQIARDKSLTNTVFRQFGLPVPNQIVATSLPQAMAAFKEFRPPVVVKPLDSSQGRGITVSVKRLADMPAAFAKANKLSRKVIIEQFLTGDDYRMLVVGGKVVAVARKIPAHVTGDGKKSIQELVDELNLDPRRKEGYGYNLQKITLDDTALTCLTSMELSPSSIPDEGQSVALRHTANISTGGTSTDVTDIVHPSNLAMAARAAEIIGLGVAGVDFITTDITRSYDETGGAICEINFCPGLRPHWFADNGPDRDVSGAILDHLFPRDSETEPPIPVIGITGTNGKTTTARMLSSILSEAGLTVGLSCSDGVYIDGLKVMNGDQAGFTGGRCVLGDPRVEAAVLETARGGILQRGIAYKSCRVSAVTNITADHLGNEGVETLEQMAQVKQLVAELAEETVVLNADDPLCLKMTDHLPERKLYLVSKKPSTGLLKKYLNGDNCIFTTKLHDDSPHLFILTASEEIPLMPVTDIPACFDGMAQHNIDNALFAVAIAHSLNIKHNTIHDALQAFSCDSETAPGRANIVHDQDFKIMIDYGHNPDGIHAIGNLCSQMKPEGQRIGILTSPSNRQDIHFSEMAKAAAKNFDHIICSNWFNLRGKPPSWVPESLQQALLNHGFGHDQITLCPEPAEAIKLAARRLQKGDFLVIFGDQTERRHQLICDEIELLKKNTVSR